MSMPVNDGTGLILTGTQESSDRVLKQRENGHTGEQIRFSPEPYYFSEKLRPPEPERQSSPVCAPRWTCHSGKGIRAEGRQMNRLSVSAGHCHHGEGLSAWLKKHSM